MKPLAIDLYCGLGGWTEGLLAEGYNVVGFDIERHEYGEHRYPAQLVLQDVTTLHGRQFRDAALIVASPPCQAYSYRAMPWKRAKALPPPDNTLFETCFRIQREASAAAGRRVPLVIENVRGTQKWVGRAEWHFGSYYLWGDVPLLMPSPSNRAAKVPGFRFDGNWSDRTKRGQDFTRIAGAQSGIKGIPHRPTGHWTNPAENGSETLSEGTKQSGSGREWFAGEGKISRMTSSKSPARKAASAMIAKIPFALAQYIARFYRTSE